MMHRCGALVLCWVLEGCKVEEVREISPKQNSQSPEMSKRSQQPSASSQTGQAKQSRHQSRILNRQYGEKGLVYRTEAGCFVVDNGQAEEVGCPSDMLQAGWKECLRGRMKLYTSGPRKGSCVSETLEATAAPAEVRCPEE